MSKRKKVHNLLAQLGFNAKEIQVVEELAAKKEISTRKVVQMAVRVYQLIDSDYYTLQPTNELEKLNH